MNFAAEALAHIAVDQQPQRVPGLMSPVGLVSRVSPVHTTARNCTRDEGGPFEVGKQVLISSHRKLLSSKAMVVLCQEDARA
jgi:hypothetical protein